MANISINSVPSWLQYTATSGQTNFSIPFPFLANADIYVWKNGILLALTTDYTLSGANTPSGGLLTLNVGASLNDIRTIQDLMVVDRTSIYQPDISALTGSALNNDFNRDVVMVRDLQTTVDYLMLQYPPYANISQDISVTTDRLLPILGANQTWQKDPTNSFIAAVALPSTVVGVDGSFNQNNRVTTTNLIPGDNYIQQTSLQFASNTLTAIGGNLTITGTNDVNISTTGQVTFNPGTNLILKGTKWPLTPGLIGQSPYLVSSTQLGWQYSVGSDIIQSNEYLFAQDVGTVNNFVMNLAPVPAMLVIGMVVFFEAANTNSGACTLNVNGFGVKPLKKAYNSPLVSGDILAGQIVEVSWDGTNWQMLSTVSNTVTGGGVNPGTIHELGFYASTGSTISGLSTLADGVLVTDGATAPSISTTLPNGLDIGIPSAGNLSNCTNLPVAGGGTGDSSFTPYAVICGGTTSTGAFQPIASVGTAMQVLTSNGAGMLPTFQDNVSVLGVNVQTFTTSGTYTPTVGMIYATIEVLGAGGGGGGCTGNYVNVAGGGGAGGFAKGNFTAAQVGASATVTIGAGGLAGTSGGGNGGTGGATSIALTGAGTITITGNGGVGGLGDSVGTGNNGLTTKTGGVGGTASNGSIVNIQGAHGANSFGSHGTTYYCQSGSGGQSIYGGAGVGQFAINQTLTGNNATGYGSGGGGASSGTITSGGGAATGGGTGSPGLIIITEYI